MKIQFIAVEKQKIAHNKFFEENFIKISIEQRESLLLKLVCGREARTLQRY